MSTEEQYRKDYDSKLASKYAELAELAERIHRLGPIEKILKKSQIDIEYPPAKKIRFLEKPKFTFEQMNTPYGL